jgi:hypothetical protein
MAGADSISAKQISAAARSSAEKLVAQHRPLGDVKFDIGFCPPPWWWIGIIIRKRLDLTLSDADKMAAELHRGIASSVPSIKGASHGAVLLDGNLTIGFVAPKEFNIIHE